MSRELRVERVFGAAAEEVFDALTDPEGLEEMYRLDDPGWILETEGDVRVGGVWRMAFGPSRGELYRFVHTYAVLDRPRRIAYASVETAPDGSSFETDVEFTLEERNGKTLMTVVQRGFPSAEVRDLHEAGLRDALDRFERRVRAGGGTRRRGAP